MSFKIVRCIRGTRYRKPERALQTAAVKFQFRKPPRLTVNTKPNGKSQMRVLLAHLPAAAMLVGCGAPAWSQTDVSTDLETIRANRNMPGLSAMVIKQGHILAQGATGVRREGSSTPLLVTDPINLGSLHQVDDCATIAGRLVDRGIINWDTRVRDLFDNYQTFNPAFYDVTLDQLLCHRGGVQE